MPIQHHSPVGPDSDVLALDHPDPPFIACLVGPGEFGVMEDGPTRGQGGVPLRPAVEDRGRDEGLRLRRPRKCRGAGTSGRVRSVVHQPSGRAWVSLKGGADTSLGSIAETCRNAYCVISVTC